MSAVTLELGSQAHSETHIFLELHGLTKVWP